MDFYASYNMLSISKKCNLKVGENLETWIVALWNH